jgi:hypothetical protein
MMMIFQVEFIDKPFVLWHSPESCKLEEKSHEPRLGEMFETRCWTKKPFSSLTDTHRSCCRRARRRHNNGDREKQILCRARNPNPKELEHLNSLSLFLSLLTGEIPKPSFRAVRGSWQRSPKEGDLDLLPTGVFLEDLLIERSTCNLSFCSCQMVWWTRNHFTLLFQRVGKTI